MSTVLLVPNRGRHEALILARQTAAWLVERGHVVRMEPGDAAQAEVELAGPELGDPGGPAGGLAEGIDLAVSLGGDGCMLRTVRLVAAAPEPAPVLGVNLGQLGYLTEVEPAGLEEALERFLAGDHDLEDRMLLEVTLRRADGSTGRYLALNEAVLERAASGRTVRLELSIDGEFFTSYVTDGLIIATPTGSTAYAFSARGPIVSPTHRAIQVTPVSPHMLFDRTLVLEADDVVDVRVAERPAVLDVDGCTVAELGDGDTVRCTGADRPARLVTFGPRDFPRILKAKFKLSDR